MRVLLFLSFFLSTTAFAQRSYTDSLQQYLADYVKDHEVVTGKDREYIRFFPIDQQYKVVAHLELKENSTWFKMESSGPLKKLYRVYAVAHFSIGDSAVQVNIYQSQSLMQTAQYRHHLFLPFTDATSGIESYQGGRYLDLSIADIENGTMVLDFNKAYNPYCAYVSGVYSCPIPPAENRLAVAIRAGEKAFEKTH